MKAAVATLQRHAAEWGETTHLRTILAADPDRAQRLRLHAAGLTLDYSHHRITDDSLRLLRDLARAAGLEARRDDLLAGCVVNPSENRAAFHTGLRADTTRPILLDGVDMSAEIEAELSHMAQFSDAVRTGGWTGATGKKIRDVVHIGIGGSYLGPRLIVDALAHCAKGGPRLHFLANIDGAALVSTLKDLKPAETLFVIASKTFTTDETMTNARSCRDWLLRGRGMDAEAIRQHFVALSTNREGVADFGIDPQNMFRFWDWVGGRYSLWSVMGLPLALSNGMADFRALLAGARAMDQHFATAPMAVNMPVIMALLGVWYRNYLGCASLAILPYDHRLALLPAWLQQLDMESNGKSVTLHGQAVEQATAPVIFGGAGTEAQHSFFQLLHQGTDVIPADFILCEQPDHPYAQHHAKLVANCHAQIAALAQGRPPEETRAALGAKATESEIAQRSYAGNRPSSLLTLPRLTPETLGALLALYEHKTFVQGTLWTINSFDQWGVELGKILADQWLARQEKN